jgi:hypothetical protein
MAGNLTWVVMLREANHPERRANSKWNLAAAPAVASVGCRAGVSRPRLVDRWVGDGFFLVSFASIRVIRG